MGKIFYIMEKVLQERTRFTAVCCRTASWDFPELYYIPPDL